MVDFCDGFETWNPPKALLVYLLKPTAQASSYRTELFIPFLDFSHLMQILLLRLAK